MNRRRFLRLGTSGFALLGLCGTPLVPLHVRAEPASSLAAFAAFAKLASAALSYMGRGANPTVPLLLSISRALDALNLKVDAINTKLDLALKDLNQIRENLEITPSMTVNLILIGEVRGHTKNFYELDPLRATPTRTYFDYVEHHFRSLRDARAQLTGTVDSTTQTTPTSSRIFDALIDVALAQDSELAMASELLRKEAFEFEKNTEPQWLMNGLRDYEGYFSSALDENRSTSIVAQKTLQRRKANELLNKRVAFRTGISDPVPIGDPTRRHLAPSIESTFRGMIERTSVHRICGSEGVVCYQKDQSGYCLEPGDFSYLFSAIQFNRERIIEAIDLTNDQLAYPYFFSVRRSYTECEIDDVTDLRVNFGHFVKDIDDLNAAILAFYRLHFIEAVARTALELNREHQRIIEELTKA